MIPYVLAKYIWLDGQKPKKLRAKTEVLNVREVKRLKDIPFQSFDGSSTFQANTGYSDLMLKPVYCIPDPIRKPPHILVLCEVYKPDGKPHKSNTRARLRKVLAKYKAEDPWVGFEQEYTLFDEHGTWPYKWLKGSSVYPAPQGNYYCGVGCDEAYGRKLPESHLKHCLEAGLKIGGKHPEVLPSQWEFKIGPLSPLEASDQLWLARWLLYQIGEDFNISAKLHPKPIDGDWNGSGFHTNFDTKKMRERNGLKYIIEACKKLEQFHEEHIKVYGPDNEKRLTGQHETCSINVFRFGIASRKVSIRIPAAVYKKGGGYFEDRRPAANADPYEVCAALLETCCGKGFIAPSR